MTIGRIAAVWLLSICITVHLPIGVWAEEHGHEETADSADGGIYVLPLTRAEVRRIQSYLGRAGFDAGVPDGLVGPRTRRAVRAFQASMGNRPSGVLTQAERERLRRIAYAYAPRESDGGSGGAGDLFAAVPANPGAALGIIRAQRSARATASVPLPTRQFAGPGQYPPMNYRGYGIIAFTATATDFDENRHLMICSAYVASLRSTFSVSTPVSDQFVTIWPINSDKLADELNKAPARAVCGRAIRNYGDVRAQEAIEAARKADFSETGIGPFLLGWLPATDYGRDEIFILQLDLSHVQDYNQAAVLLHAWKRDIQSDPELLKPGFNLEQLRRKIQLFADKYGEGFLSLLG